MKCQGKTKSGQACKMPAIKGTHLCFTHSPNTRKAQAAARRLGGYNSSTPHAGKPETIPATITTIEAAAPIVRYVLDELLTMDNSIARARALLACFDSFVKAFEIGELEKRIQALEERSK